MEGCRSIATKELGQQTLHQYLESIDSWRTQRKKLIENFESTLTSLNTCTCKSSLFIQIRSLCADIVDYVASGHFSIYWHPLKDFRYKPAETQSMMTNTYRHISATTDQVLDFNDKCERYAEDEQTLLRDELLKLQSPLIMRFALEEQFLELGSSA